MPSKDVVLIGFLAPQSLADKLSERAKLEDRSRSSVIRAALKAHLAEDTKAA